MDYHDLHPNLDVEVRKLFNKYLKTVFENNDNISSIYINDNNYYWCSHICSPFYDFDSKYIPCIGILPIELNKYSYIEFLHIYGSFGNDVKNPNILTLIGNLDLTVNIQLKLDYETIDNTYILYKRIILEPEFIYDDSYIYEYPGILISHFKKNLKKYESYLNNLEIHLNIIKEKD